MSFGQDYDYLFKILLIGNSSVGKSSILLRFSDNIFNESFLPTIGVDFKIKTFDIQGKTVKLQIWDTAGQERFKTITSSYYKGSNGIILTYDITDKQSFKDVENWLAEVEKYAKPDIVKLLVGNKSDLESQRQVTKEEGQELADSLNVKFIETSAKNSVNIEGAFMTLSQEIKNIVQLDSNTNPKPRENRRLDEQGSSTQKNKGCC